MKTSKTILMITAQLLLIILSLSACADTAAMTAATDSPVSSVTTVPSVNTVPSVPTAPAITTTATPVTTAPDAPVTLPATTDEQPTTEEQPNSCTEIFTAGLAAAGQAATVSRDLTADELSKVKAFLESDDVCMIFASSYEPFYRPEDISLYEMIYADTENEFTDNNPYPNDGSMVSVTRIKRIIKQYLGIDVTDAMWDRLVADGAEYLAEYDAYGFAHTDASGFSPDDTLTGYQTEDGKLLIHMQCKYDGDAVWALLIPTDNGYLIEAAQRHGDRNAPCTP